MKRKYFILLFVLGLTCLFFGGCSFKNDVASISIVSQNQEEISTIEIGQFNYSDYKLCVEYKNGTKEETELTEDMISENERLKFFQVGEQNVLVQYKRKECELKINVKRKSLESLALKDKVAIFTGKPITIEVEGNIPANVSVRYPNGNSFTNAGTYDISAVVYGDEYEIKELSATLVIEKAKYDMSNIVFESKEFTYDKNSKSLTIQGELPSGVYVEYKIGDKQGNSEIDAGVYTVTAKFTSNNQNYESIEDKTATLTINKAKIENIDVDLEDKNVIYNGHSYSIDANINKLPKGVNLTYIIQKTKDAKGNSVQELEQAGNSAIFAGTYVVKVVFKLEDSTNYESIEPQSATLFIERAEYSLDDVYLYSSSVAYDGNSHALSLSGNVVGEDPTLPLGVEVKYEIKKIKDKNGNSISQEAENGNSAIDVGTYQVTASFVSSDENYKELESKTAILEIYSESSSDVVEIENIEKEIN